jgi:CheY-like chemotaxis protein
MSITKEPSTWRVLIVDDEPDNLRLASDLLEYSGATIAGAPSGQQALDLIGEFKPNLILLDLAMPKLDGWEMHRQLRAKPEFDQVPIIALTALAMPADSDKVRAAGFDGYIVKPFLVRALLVDIATCVEEFVARKSADTHAEVAIKGQNDD